MKQYAVRTIGLIAILIAAVQVFPCDFSAWQHSKKWYLNTTTVGANITTDVPNFPVCIRLNASNFLGFSECNANGTDVRFKQGNTELAYEIEQWDATASKGIIWVKIPVVYGNNGSQYVEMYWGNTAATTTTANSSSVFETSNGYKAVYHLKETSGNIIDATANNYYGSRFGSITKTTAVVGDGQILNGTTDYVGMNDVCNLGTSNITVSGWVKRTQYGVINTIMAKSNGGLPSGSYGWLFSYDWNNTLSCYVANGGTNWGDAGSFEMQSNITITDSLWHYVAAVINKSGNSSCKLYIDGIDKTGTITGNITSVGSPSNTGSFRIGAESDAEFKFKGSIDEASLAFSARSADWIKLSFENQKTNQTLVQNGFLLLANDGRGTAMVSSSSGSNTLSSITRAITAVPWTGYAFAGWSTVAGNADSVIYDNAANYATNVRIVNGEAIVMANFKAVSVATSEYPNFCGAGDSMKVDGGLKVGGGVTIGDPASDGSTITTEKVVVNGRIKCESIKIKNWLLAQKTPDFVFDKGYKLNDLKSVEEYIKVNGHLPEVPSVKDVQKDGIELSEFNLILLRKIEELTLYSIEMKKELDALKKKQ